MNAKTKDSCRDLFEYLNILPVRSQYVFSLTLFVVKNKAQYKSNQEIHNYKYYIQYEFTPTNIKFGSLSKRGKLLWN
jgi:hypothetical protein